MKVEVCYADAKGATRVALDLDDRATLADAIDASRIIENLSLDVQGLSFGIFGRRAELTARLCEGDRVEIYRPLIVDPKDARRRRAEKKRVEAAKRGKKPAA